jgi:hypothetical protein
MTAKKRPVDSGEARQRGPAEGPDSAGGGQAADSVDASGPQSPAPWGSAGGIDREPPWGASEDSPLDEGSEPTAVPEGRRGERRAGRSTAVSGRHGFGSVEPTRVGEAGPLERQTGMRPEGVARRE